jgi:hypothetical protein
MKHRSTVSGLRFLALFLAAARPGGAWAGWKPLEPAHLTQQTPSVEPGADAEALFWDVRVEDDEQGGSVKNVLSHEVRIKVYNERGREAWSRFDIPYFSKRTRIRDIEGRTIQPDGSIVELKKSDVFERMVYRLSGVKRKVKSFALPAVGPGSILDVRWREVRDDQLANYMRLPLQQDLPIRSYTITVKPLSHHLFPYGMRYRTFFGQIPPFQKAGHGWHTTTLENVPAFHEEPHMPPEDSVRPWLLVYYSEPRKIEPKDFWKELGREAFKWNKPAIETKANAGLKKVAAEVCGDASTPEQKLERLFEFCRTRIQNVTDDASGLSDRERAEYKEAKTAEETFKRGKGTGYEIDRLFAALASAAGFDTRIALVPDRGDVFFDPSFADPYLLSSFTAAVKLGDGWRFYDPASTYVPHGMLRWQEEGIEALVTDPKEPLFVTTPLSPTDRSVIRRTATMRLAEDGTLEGDVKVELSGHPAAEQKEDNDELTPAEREQALREDLQQRLGAAEVSQVRIENVSDPVQPLVYAYRLRVPGYAQRTGKRLFVQPALFQRGVGPRFPNQARKHLIYFHYAWSEEDTVRIELPPGHQLESLEAPTPFRVQDFGRYEAKLELSKDGRVLEYRRGFRLSLMLVPVEGYGALKTVFDTLYERDGHTVSLKQGPKGSL